MLTSRAVENGTSPAELFDDVKTVEILVDRASIEVFVNGGEVSSTRFVLPKEDGLSVKTEGSPVEIRSLTVFNLKSAWPSGVGD